MNNTNILYKIDPNLRVLLVPLFLIVAALGLTTFSIKTGYAQVNSQIKQLENIDSQQQKLSVKLEILRDVQEGLLEYTNASLIAMPDKNPTTWSISLLRSSIYQNSLKLLRAEGKFGTKGDNFYNVIFNLELEGGLEDLLLFANSTKEMAPILRIKLMDIQKNKASYIANFEMVTFWADLPKKLPAIDEPISSLNKDELTILVDLKKLLRPEFNVLEPQEVSGRQSPFR